MRLERKHQTRVLSSDVTYGGESSENMGTKSIECIPSVHEDLLWGQVGVGGNSR